MTNRSELRRRFRQLRRALPADLRLKHADAITRHFFASGFVLRGNTIGAYLSRADGLDGEVDLSVLLDRLCRIGKRIAVPVLHSRATMEFYEYHPAATLINNRFQIPEPDLVATHVHRISQNLMLTPLVAFDESGVRMGMGGGFYDRYLGSIPPLLRPLVIGVAHEVQRSSTPLPCESWDIRLDGVITEAGWQSFR